MRPGARAAEAARPRSLHIVAAKTSPAVTAIVVAACTQGSRKCGQDAVITGENLRLHFDEVLEDSRCPAQVECVWTGQARIAVVVHAAASTPITVAFNTNPAPGQNAQTAQVGEYKITLLSLEPYPQTPEDPIDLEQYRATLEVSKSAP
jgi:hypothetical protein